MSQSQFLDINGSFGEGGGAIIRLSAAFSILYDRPIRVKNIRKNRPKPGLRTQHLLGLESLKRLTNSNLSNCTVGSEEISFIPNTKSIKETIDININTAASIGLLLQPIQIACLKFRYPEIIQINLLGGGTFGKWAPSLNYLSNVTYKIFKNSGLDFDTKILKYGFYPKGNASTKCIIKLSQKELQPINLTTLGDVRTIEGEIVITNQLANKRISERIINEVKSILNNKLPNIKVKIEILSIESSSPGVCLCLWGKSINNAIISSGTFLGEKHVTSEELGRRATNQIVKYIQNDIPVDNYLSDQLIPLMGYVPGGSKIKVLEVTQHTRTNLELVKMFSKREYEITKNGKSYIIEFESKSLQ